MQNKITFLQKAALMLCIALFGTFPKSIAQRPFDDVKEKIEEMDEVAERVDHGIDAISNFNGKNEFWSIDEPDTSTRSIYIWSYVGDRLYAELFVEKDGILDFAVEWEKEMPLNHYSQSTWQCVYFLNNGEVVDYTSLGHGKTEDDQWNPEGIITQFGERKAQLEKIKK